MNKILVTGATGFIGNYIINKLLELKQHVVATSNLPHKEAKKFTWYNKVEYIQKNLNIPNLLDYELFGKPEVLIHLAWEGLPNYNENYHIERNLPMSLLFVKNMIECGVKNISVAGTCAEYGMKSGELSEDEDVDPVLKYSIAKNILRQQIEDLQNCFDFNFTWNRIFYVYGDGQSSKSLLGQIKTAIINNETIFNMSEGSQERDFIHVYDVANKIVNLSLNNNNNGIVNICSGVPMKVIDFVERQFMKVNYNISLNRGYYPYPDYEPMRFWGSTKKSDFLLKLR